MGQCPTWWPPSEYTWRLLFNAAKFGWRPLLECSAVMLTRRKTRWNLQGCPKLANRCQPLVSQSSLYYQDTCRRYWCLTSFFSICRYMPQLRRYSPTKLCDGAKMATFCILYFQQAACSTVQLLQRSQLIQCLSETCHFRVSPFCKSSAEAQVIWGGILKHLLSAYFIGNISAKKYRSLSTCVRVTASQRWDVFLRHGVYIAPKPTNDLKVICNDFLVVKVNCWSHALI